MFTIWLTYPLGQEYFVSTPWAVFIKWEMIYPFPSGAWIKYPESQFSWEVPQKHFGKSVCFILMLMRRLLFENYSFGDHLFSQVTLVFFSLSTFHLFLPKASLFFFFSPALHRVCSISPGYSCHSSVLENP